MDKLEVLCRAWIDCDPNRYSEPGSGFHADDLMEPRQHEEVRNAKGEVVWAGTKGVGDELVGLPRWRWFMPRAVALEDYLEQRGFVIVPLEYAQRGGAVGKEWPLGDDTDKETHGGEGV